VARAGQPRGHLPPQRLGLAIGTMRLFSVPGRRSGELRTTPVSPLTMSGLRYVVGLQDADWVKNARTAGWGILTCGRNEERVVLVELPPEERAPVLRAFPREVPHGVRVLSPAGDRGFSRLGGFRGGRAAVRCLPHRGLAEQRR
jgi:hypothetical protein